MTAYYYRNSVICMNWAEIKYNDIANGEGVRTSLFVSGCRHHCKNCFNEIAWDFQYGKPFDEATAEKILNSVEPDWINGVSLLGGEPFEPENQQALLDFLTEFKARFANKNVWCYTGFTYEEIMGTKAESRCFTDISKQLLSRIDILVDGRFVEKLKDIRLKFRGSSNQRIIDVQKSLATGEIVLYME